MTDAPLRRRLALGLLLASQLLLAACATVGPDPRDPWEPFNRSVSRFNDAIDQSVLEPVARGYQNVLPGVVRSGVSNFFGNLSDVWSAANNLLQLKPRETADSLMRVGINSTIGVFGLVDVATELQIQRHREDFGQTLGRWGVGTGPYLVLPLLGPSTLRDAVALPVDWQGDLVNGANARVQTPLSVLRVVDLRANLLTATGMLDAAALDRYTFLRDAHLQRRRGARPPIAPMEPEERYDLPELPAAPDAPAPVAR